MLKLSDLKARVPKILCLTLLALAADKGFAQEPKPRNEKPQSREEKPQPKEERSRPSLLDQIKQRADELAGKVPGYPPNLYKPVIGEKTPCGNGDFEPGLSAAEWQGAYGTVPNSGVLNFASFTNGMMGGALNANTAHQTWESAGTDANGINRTAPVTPASTHSVRIGNAVSGGGAELLSKTFVVTPAQSNIAFWYAVVFQNPGNVMPMSQRASFWVRVTVGGVEIPNLVNVGGIPNTAKLIADATNPVFQNLQTTPGTPSLLYKEWSCAQINLSGQIGQVVTIEFVTADSVPNAASPGGYAYAYLDNFCGNCGTPPPPPPVASKYCCPGKNLVQNGDFELGNAFFTSAHLFNGATTPAFVTAPGQYNVVTSPQAIAISPLWNATDHAVCNGFSGSKFLVANGKTTQPPNTRRIVWQQTVPVTKDKEYRFCANFKNFAQATFDIKPRVWIEFTNPNTTIGPVTVNEAAGLCNWRLIDTTVFPTTTALTIKIILDESGQGDGNDLAIDDISLQEKTQVSSNLVGVNYATNDIGGGQYNVSATPVPLPPGYNYGWLLGEWDPITNGFVGFTNLVINPPSWQTAPLPNTFAGYNGLNGSLTGSAPGKFAYGKIYKIFYVVWSDCESFRASTFLLQYNKMLQKPQVTPQPLREQDMNLLRKYLPQGESRTKSEPFELSRRETPVRMAENSRDENMALPRAEDDPSVEIAVAKPSVAVGQQAPDFKVEDAAGTVWRLSDLRNKKNVLLTFFPKCFTGGCANHLSSLRDRQAEFDATDTQIMAVSVDPAAGERGQAAFACQWQLTFPLVPDTQRSLSKLYGAVRNDRQLAARMSIFIDKQGIVRFVDTDVNVRNHGADVVKQMHDIGL